MDFQLTADQKDLQARARELARGSFEARAAEIDRSEQYPWNNVEDLKNGGFMGMTIPKAYGGQGRTFFDATLVIEQMAQVCGVTGRIVVESNMGAISTVMKYGTEEQKKMAAEYVLNGDKPAICITEPDAGSAATEMTTRADKKGDKYIINGKKHWITGAGASQLHLVFARVFDEQGEEQGIGGFLGVRDETPGLSIGNREPTMGLRGIPEAEVIMQDMEVGEDALVMPPRGLRKGFADLMDAYNSQRVGAGTMALGIAQGAYQHALDYVQEREQFGRPIYEFQGLQWMLADMAIQIDCAQLMLYRAAANAGDSFPDATEAAKAKVIAADMALKVTNDALQLFGAAGYSRRRPMERLCRDGRMFSIGGGTAQILRTVVATRILGKKLPQTRDGYTKLAEYEAAAAREAAE
ncbi:MAG: 3-sulfinopropanoyl-CoA desulfinase [Pseudomonadota bacterium]|nr:3-sulfinopropanoyl-CoA desulfinase [Pseudomonadota bacterium]